MKCLIDTHVLIWWLEDSVRLPDEYRTVISDASNQIYVSKATAWEIEIKRSIGKLSIAEDYIEKAVGFTWLPIELEHIEALRGLPLIHRDPFDRMLVAQSKVEGMPVLSVDDQVVQYGVVLGKTAQILKKEAKPL